MEPEEEVDMEANHLEAMINGFRIRRPIPHVDTAEEIEPGTDLVFFDYGGAMGGYGPNPVWDHTRHLFQWAEDNPSSLLLIISGFFSDRIIAEVEHSDSAIGSSIPFNTVFRHSFKKEQRYYGVDDVEKWYKGR